MTMTQQILVKKEKIGDMKRRLLGTHWQGSDQLPERKNMLCRKVEVGQDRGEWVLLVAIYEG